MFLDKLLHIDTLVLTGQNSYIYQLTVDTGCRLEDLIHPTLFLFDYIFFRSLRRFLYGKRYIGYEEIKVDLKMFWSPNPNNLIVAALVTYVLDEIMSVKMKENIFLIGFVIYHLID